MINNVFNKATKALAAMTMVFFSLSLLNFWIAAEFSFTAIAENLPQAFWFQPLYMFIWTVIIFVGKPITDINNRHLSILVVIVSILEAHISGYIMFAAYQLFYIANFIPTIFSFISLYLISNRENFSLTLYKLFLSLPFSKQWAQQNVSRLFITELDLFIRKVFLFLACCFLLLDSCTAAFALYHHVPWQDGNLLRLIEQENLFDIYELKLAIIDWVMTLTALVLVNKMLMVHSGFDIKKLAMKMFSK